MVDGKISQKYGFGMAPTKSNLQEKRSGWVNSLLGQMEKPSEEVVSPEAVSEVKGLFNRVVRQDQWDWFTVFQQLGCPGRVKSRRIASKLTDLRGVLTGKSEFQINDVMIQLKELGTERHLLSFLERRLSGHVGESIYILSTREQPRVLKIGFTTRPVIDRVKEINSATGVLVPFGVRALWRVRNGQQIEGELHKEFSQFRIRKDREFFEMDFNQAFKRVNNLLARTRLEEE